jgi:hypothetical protein
VAGAMTEVEPIRAMPTNAESGPSEPLSGAVISNFVKLAERPGRPANPSLDRLLEHLMESVGRQARRQAAEAIRKANR